MDDFTVRIGLLLIGNLIKYIKLKKSKKITNVINIYQIFILLIRAYLLLIMIIIAVIPYGRFVVYVPIKFFYCLLIFLLKISKSLIAMLNNYA